jgi:hypothetical protein
MYCNVEVIMKICPGAWGQLIRSIDASNCVMSSAFRAFLYPVTRPWSPEDSISTPDLATQVSCVLSAPLNAVHHDIFNG